MSSIWPLGLLVFCGAMIAVQSAINSALSRSVGLAWFSVFFSGIQLACALSTLIWARPARGSEIFSNPLWYYAGGVMGIFILCGMAFGVGRVGAFAGMISLLVGQLFAGLLIDHTGAFGVLSVPISWPRALGLGLVLAGLLLTRY